MQTILDCDSPLYTTPRKFRGVAGEVDFFAQCLEPKRLAKVLRAELKPSKHFAYTMLVMMGSRANDANSEHTLFLNAAAAETWGRPWGIADYKISGIGSDEFPEHYKTLLRACAHNHSKYSRLEKVWREVWRSIR